MGGDVAGIDLGRPEETVGGDTRIEVVDLNLRRRAKLALEDVESYMSANAPCLRRPSAATNSPLMKRTSTSKGRRAVAEVSLSVRIPIPGTKARPTCPLKSVIVDGSLVAGSGLPNGG